MNILKIFSISFVISFMILSSTSIAVFPNEKSQNIFEYENSQIIFQDLNEKIFMIGRITNLHIEEDIAVFNPIKLWYLSSKELDNEKVWSFGHTTNQNKTFCFNNDDFKRIITRAFIFGLLDSDIINAPQIIFIKEDTNYQNSLTVAAAEPSDIAWMNIETRVNGTAIHHGMSGAVTAGDIIDISALAGVGYYTISIRYIPLNTLIGIYNFVGIS